MQFGIRYDKQVRLDRNLNIYLALGTPKLSPSLQPKLPQLLKKESISYKMCDGKRKIEKWKKPEGIVKNGSGEEK